MEIPIRRDFTPDELKARLKTLGPFGLISCWEQIATKPWLHEVLDIEERERQKRGFERRLRDSRVGTFKPMVDFDWKWPRKIDRQGVDELFGLGFMKRAITPSWWAQWNRQDDDF